MPPQSEPLPATKAPSAGFVSGIEQSRGQEIASITPQHGSCLAVTGVDAGFEGDHGIQGIRCGEINFTESNRVLRKVHTWWA